MRHAWPLRLADELRQWVEHQLLRLEPLGDLR
jgi:hypothetical protein